MMKFDNFTIKVQVAMMSARSLVQEQNHLPDDFEEKLKKIGIEKILSKVLKQLTDDRPIEIQRSFALILQQTVKDEDEEIKKRVISLLKRRCKMSQDPIICKALHKIRES